ncbi:hypothetical protein BVC71_14700 [Marivivens niveibacter]|uniref:Uncharacterized protein n=1 Tax=Marivivens niveibacter TaxID=1930667 RepID=A0A251WVR1_9RHOB|nr:hypothetical protein BVC71_14700 [Marivivens niveibacter]
MSNVLLACRALIALLLFYVVTCSIVNGFGTRLSLLFFPFDISHAIFDALLSISAIWLVFGLHTRIMAAFSVAYLGVYVVLVMSQNIVDPTIVYAPGLALFLATPLMMFGGGAHCLTKRGAMSA